MSYLEIVESSKEEVRVVFFILNGRTTVSYLRSVTVIFNLDIQLKLNAASNITCNSSASRE